LRLKNKQLRSCWVFCNDQAAAAAAKCSISNRLLAAGNDVLFTNTR
jgi:hypothetical protein